MTTSQRTWAIQVVAAGMTGGAVWALLKWIGSEPAFISGALVALINLVLYRLWPVDGRTDSGSQGRKVTM